MKPNPNFDFKSEHESNEHSIRRLKITIRGAVLYK